MALQFRHGRVEVETDILLGVEDVLLPEGVDASRQAVADAVADRGASDGRMVPLSRGGASAQLGASSASASRRFEADLFLPTGAAAVRAGEVNRAEVNRAGVDRIGAPSNDAPPKKRPALPAVAPTTEADAVAASAAPLIDRIVPPMGASKAEQLRLLAELHARECPHCTVTTGHRTIVFGEGDPEAALVFVGEAPGDLDDLAGRPFVGPAGEKLDGMIAAMGLSRAKVYIGNVVKTRPPDNRTPLGHEVERCAPYLLAQLAVIRPRAIVTLGGPASKLLLSTELGITRLRGVVAKVTLGAAGGAPFEVPVMPTFHPAYLLRNYTAEVRGQVWSDLLQVIDLLGLPRPARKRADEPSRE
jgi:DNA polymerase